MLLAKDMAHSITNFSESSIGLDGVNNQGHEVFSTCRSPLQRLQNLLHSFIVSSLAQRRELCRLPSAHFGIHAQQRWPFLLFLNKAIDTDYNSPLFLQSTLILVCRLLDLRLQETSLDGVHAASQVKYST